MTNLDMIRNLPKQELIDILNNNTTICSYISKCEVDKSDCLNCSECISKWLEREAPEAKTVDRDEKLAEKMRNEIYNH